MSCEKKKGLPAQARTRPSWLCAAPRALPGCLQLGPPRGLHAWRCFAHSPPHFGLRQWRAGAGQASSVGQAAGSHPQGPCGLATLLSRSSAPRPTGAAAATASGPPSTAAAAPALRRHAPPCLHKCSSRTRASRPTLDTTRVLGRGRVAPPLVSSWRLAPPPACPRGGVVATHPRTPALLWPLTHRRV